MSSKQLFRYSFAVLLLYALLYALPMLMGSWAVFDKDYLLASVQKQERLKHLKSPRLILVGCSNLAFGVDSKLLQQKTGYQVVNMGLHQELGHAYMLAEVQSQLKKGDVVIISWAYALGEGQQGTRTQLALANVTAADFLYSRGIDRLTFPIQKAQRALEIAFINAFLRPKPSKIYGLHAFDTMGDVCVHEHLAPVTFAPIALDTPPQALLEAERRSLEAFCKQAHELEARVYILPPVLAQSSYQHNFAVINTIWGNYADIPYLEQKTTPQSYVLPDSAFFDTPYHLKFTQRAWRSKKIIDDVAF